VNYLYHPLKVEGLGFDFMSEAARREAIIYAMNTGTTSLTSKIDFVRSKTEIGGSGVTMFIPVYQNASQSKIPVEERTPIGLVFAPISTDQFFERLFTTTSANPQTSFRVKIY